MSLEHEINFHYCRLLLQRANLRQASAEAALQNHELRKQVVRLKLPDCHNFCQTLYFCAINSSLA
jgi:hypothetical protein